MALPASPLLPPLTAQQVWRAVWKLVQTPLRILLIGLVAIALLQLWKGLGLPGPGRYLALLVPQAGTPEPAVGGRQTIFIALLVMASAILVVAMLWWLIARYFRLIQSGIVGFDPAGMRDLPLGLPEGTVRAILALIVGVVGLPILIFSNLLELDTAIAGYVNGIIAGVFGFYFGSRTTTPATQALNQVAAAGREVDAARKRIDEIAAEKDAAVRNGQKGDETDRLARQLELAAVLLNPIGALLPAGALPGDLAAKVAAAEDALKKLGAGPPDAPTLAAAKAAGAALLTGSALRRLITTAAPMADGQPATLAALLGLGWNLPAAPYQRWYALVHAAPVTPSLIDGATVGLDELNRALAAAAMPSDTVRSEWTAARASPGFAERLNAIILAEDAVETMWAEHGKLLPGGDGDFSNRDSVVAGLAAVQREILAARLERDVTEATTKPVLDRLATAADTSLRPPSGFGTAALLRAARAAGSAAAGSAAAVDARAAFDALVMLVGVARQGTVDLPIALAELQS